MPRGTMALPGHVQGYSRVAGSLPARLVCWGPHSAPTLGPVLALESVLVYDYALGASLWHQGALTSRSCPIRHAEKSPAQNQQHRGCQPCIFVFGGLGGNPGPCPCQAWAPPLNYKPSPLLALRRDHNGPNMSLLPPSFSFSLSLSSPSLSPSPSLSLSSPLPLSYPWMFRLIADSVLRGSLPHHSVQTGHPMT